MSGKSPRITLYTTSRCAHCKQARRWLKQRGIRFQEFDIERSQRAFKDYQRLGTRGVPVLLINQQRVDGFDPRRLEAALKKAGA